jgi:hypothetical protein
MCASTSSAKRAPAVVIAARSLGLHGENSRKDESACGMAEAHLQRPAAMDSKRATANRLKALFAAADAASILSHCVARI